MIIVDIKAFGCLIKTTSTNMDVQNAVFTNKLEKCCNFKRGHTRWKDTST